MFLETRIIDLHFATDSMVYIRSNFSGGLHETLFSITVHFGRSGSSKVIDFGTDWKHVCNFLLVRDSNLGPISLRFRKIAGFCAHDPTPIPH